MFIFPIIFLASFFVSLKEVVNGNRQGILLFFIFGLSIYTTAMAVAFMLGFKAFIPFFQFFKELLVLTTLSINVYTLKSRPRFHLIDYLALAFLAYTTLYAILPIGTQSFSERLIALKSISFFILVYFTGRLTDLRSLYISKYFNYVLILTIAAGIIVSLEVLFNQNLQAINGHADYVYYFFNFEPSGTYGLGTTFESEGGYRRFASFFQNPLEHANATLIALAILMALYTRDDNKLDYKPIGIIGFVASLLSITFAFSRAPLVSYFLMIYIYGFITNKRTVLKFIHTGFLIVGCYVLYAFIQLENKVDGVMAVVLSTLDFSNPSSVGHLLSWIEGITAMIAHPLGLGLGTSGRVAGSLGDVTGGENQFIIIGVQAGVIGLGLYMAIYILFIKQGLKWFKILRGKERKICLAVLMIKFGIMITLFTSEIESSTYISYMNWFLSGLFIAVIMQHKPEEVYAKWLLKTSSDA